MPRPVSLVFSPSANARTGCGSRISCNHTGVGSILIGLVEEFMRAFSAPTLEAFRCIYVTTVLLRKPEQINTCQGDSIMNSADRRLACFFLATLTSSLRSAIMRQHRYQRCGEPVSAIMINGVHDMDSGRATSTAGSRLPVDSRVRRRRR